MAEGGPLLGVIAGGFEGRLGDAHRLGRYPDPPAVERAHRDLEALALLAEDVARGHPAVLEVHLGGR